jgi:hypothetical protein
MPDLAGGRLPADVAHLPGFSAAVLADGLGGVVVVSGLGLPGADRVRIEGPVRDVEAVDAIDQRASLEGVRRQPLAGVPLANLLADLFLADLERQQALRPDRCLDLLVVDECGRTAELAVLADAFRIEHRNGLAALALDGPLLRHPAAVFVRQLAQRFREVELLDSARRRVDAERRRGPAERAHEKLLGRVPLGLGSARGARILL